MFYVLQFIALGFLLLIVFGLWKLFRFSIVTWQSDSPNRWIKRSGVAVVAFGLVASPVAIYFSFEAAQTRSLVPSPLQAVKIEFEAEENWGFGPGGNETGFVVYKLKNNSTQWLRSKGKTVGASLPGGNEVWLPTPIVASEINEPWFVIDSAEDTISEVPSIANYLNRYGFSISIDPQQKDELNQSLRKAGCLYSYGRGGSVTVIDPNRGRVYFAYSG
jgi:hypothetical protein